ncbi:hypothetical protein F4803DRAFT_529470 [Xylaria telfairii]|nr:hypothetical protein F4803DRAFT_529470 [Xylaria telfairii]
MSRVLISSANRACQMSGLEANEGQEIFDWAQRCEGLFQKLLSTLVGHGGIGAHYRAVRDYFQRFELWAGFIGVFTDGSISLDHRLKLYPETRDLVLRMLKLLERNLSHSFWFDPASKEEIVSKDPLVIASGTSTSLAAVAALDAIREAIDRLRRLAVLIRKSPSSSLTSRVEAFAHKVNPGNVEEFQKMASLIVTGRLPSMSSSLAAQLVSSISFRRLRLLYEGKHNEKLKGRRIQTILELPQLETEKPRWEEVPVSVQDDLSRLDILQTETPPARSFQQPAYSETEDSGFDLEKFQHHNSSLTDVSDTSTITSIARGYCYPPRPKHEIGDQYCACNWCSDEIKVSNLNIPGWWRAHFKKDLQPYVCISEDCSEPAVYFTSFSKWRKHMDDVHTTDWARRIHSPQVWYCDVSPHEYLEFREKRELEHHLKTEHSNDLNSNQLKRRLVRNTLPSPRGENICPLCNQDILKVFKLQEQVLGNYEIAPSKVADEKVPASKGPRVKFQDMEDFTSLDEETSKNIAEDVSSSSKTEEKRKLDLGKVSRHIAGHLKALAFLSIRYLDHDAVAGEGDSGKAESGANYDDIEDSNRADKAIERILDDFPEAADGNLEFGDIPTERIDVGENEHLEEAAGFYEAKIDITPKGEIKTSDSPEEARNSMAKQKLFDEEKCRELFRIAAGSKYKRAKDQVETRAEGTCHWFLHHEHFKRWLEQESGVLLVTADVGCGKSVLAKHLIDEALPRSATISYFFFNDQDQNNFSQALCALLHQLFCRQPSLIRHAMPRYVQYGQDLTGLAPSLWGIMKDAGRDPVIGSSIMVLDALNECAESDLQYLFRMLSGLYSPYGLGPSKIKFLLTSRPYGDIVSELSRQFGDDLLSISLSGDQELETARDELNHLIKDRVEQLATDKKLPKHTKDYLATRLLDIPSPTYLWVYLVFEYLAAINLEIAPNEAEIVIASLPESINEAYEQTLNKTENYLIVRKALCIILGASQPLTVLEMNVAMSVNKQCNSISDIELGDEKNFESHFEALLGSLVSIRHAKIYLIHHTMAEFIVKKSLSSAIIPSKLHWQHSISIGYAHSVLAELCILYLNLFDPRGTLPSDANGEANYAFFNYSTKNWVTHLYEAFVKNHESGAGRMVLLGDLGSKAYLLWSEEFPYWEGAKGPLVIGEKGYSEVIQLLFDQSAGLESNTGRELQALFWAVVHEFKEVVQLLLDRGADLESRDDNGSTALLTATVQGSEEVVQLLLDRGANLESRDHYGRTALLKAVIYGFKKVIQLLLDRGADLESRDYDGCTALSTAAMHQSTEVVQLLLDRGADLESRNYGGRTALLRAAEYGRIEVLLLLLDRGANSQTMDNVGHTPLSIAQNRGHMAVAQLLRSL